MSRYILCKAFENLGLILWLEFRYVKFCTLISCRIIINPYVPGLHTNLLPHVLNYLPLLGQIWQTWTFENSDFEIININSRRKM